MGIKTYFQLSKCVETIYYPPKSVMIWRRHSPDYNIYLDGLGNHNQE